MEEKYIHLLMEKGTELKEKKKIFIHYSKEIEDFIKKLTKTIQKQGITEIYLDSYDPYEIHKNLQEHNLEEIKTSSLFDESHWDKFAKEDYCFLIFVTEYPHLMDDIEKEKISLSNIRKVTTKPYYQKLVETCQISWCIAPYPGKMWAKDIFNTTNSYQKLKKSIFKACLLEEKNPIQSWNQYLQKNNQIRKYLNQSQIKKLIYTNSFGTNLEVYLPDHYIFSNAEDRKILVNLPSYEIFATPVYNLTKGIVYSSKPLNYNGITITDFWLKFEDGRVVDYDAKEGKETLQKILTTDSTSCYLGECAFVEKTSPIASSNIIYKTTLLDENASCHLALGNGLPECIQNGLQMNSKELKQAGINQSMIHIDFMIGTDDLKIIAVTTTQKEFPIFENGKFSKELLKESRVVENEEFIYKTN